MLTPKPAHHEPAAVPEPNELQAVEQEILTEAVTLDEEVQQANPQLATTVSHDQINQLAGELWLAAGGIPNSPLTLNFWLQAEVQLNAEIGGA